MTGYGEGVPADFECEPRTTATGGCESMAALRRSR